MVKNTLVVNLFAAPGVGKTTTMSAVFTELKQRGVDTELATEFVKELLWEGCKVDELYVLAEQNHKLFRLNGKVDVIVTDRPLPLSVLFNPNNLPLCNIAMQTFNDYRNVNYLLLRNPDIPYSSNGRYQTESQSVALDNVLKDLLGKNEIPYKEILAGRLSANIIADDIQHLL